MNKQNNARQKHNERKEETTNSITSDIHKERTNDLNKEITNETTNEVTNK